MENIAVVLLTCEIEYLEEWYLHHKKIGFKNFFVFLDSQFNYDFNKLNKNILSEIKNIKTFNIKNEFGDIIPLALLYTSFCREYTNFDYVLFIDSDEYYESKTNNINEDICLLKQEYGDFDALGLCWRLYGSNPVFENKMPITSYKQWHPSTYIKSLVNPKSVYVYPSPHHAFLKDGFNKYINEFGQIINSHKLLNHTSEKIWIKHIRTRSRSEWFYKMERKGWYEKIAVHNKLVKRSPTKFKSCDDYFNIYNSNCVFID